MIYIEFPTSHIIYLHNINRTCRLTPWKNTRWMIRTAIVLERPKLPAVIAFLPLLLLTRLWYHLERFSNITWVKAFFILRELLVAPQVSLTPSYLRKKIETLNVFTTIWQLRRLPSLHLLFLHHPSHFL